MPASTPAAGLHVALVNFDGFNEIDCFVALGLLNRLRPQGVVAEICGPGHQIRSMNGVAVEIQRPLEFTRDADVVLFGSGIYTRAVAENGAITDRLQLDPTRQLVGAQCSGALLLARLGLLADQPACTDLLTRPFLLETGVRVVDRPFHARGPVATAGGCMASVYLGAWVARRLAGDEMARQALHYIAPVGEKDSFVDHAMAVVDAGGAPADAAGAV